MAGMPGTKSKSVSTPIRQCFSVRMAGDNDIADLTVLADGKPTKIVRLTGVYQRIQISAGDSIELSNSYGYNMRVKDLGCGNE